MVSESLKERKYSTLGALNTYYDSGSDDLQFACDMLEMCKNIGKFNTVIDIFSLASEKLLKSVIEVIPEDKDIVKLLRFSSTILLFDYITTHYPMNTSREDCKTIGDYYFLTKYPGDDFISASLEDAEDAKRIALSIKADIDRIHELSSKD